MSGHDEDTARLSARLREMALACATRPGTFAVAGGALAFHRIEAGNAVCSLYRPHVALIVQGSRESVVGGTRFDCGAGSCVIAGMDMPGESRVVGATPARPFLAASMALDRGLVAQLAAELPQPQRQEPGEAGGFCVLEAGERLVSAFLRLAALENEPEAIPILAPMLAREICCRLLLGPRGAWLRSLCAEGGRRARIAKAVSWLRQNYREPLHVEELARRVGMSSSNFFRNFRLVTGTSPLQFQKVMRLYEAQRLMLSGTLDVAEAAYAVGYESSTQFIREYKRLFGEPPHRDIIRRRVELR